MPVSPVRTHTRWAVAVALGVAGSIVVSLIVLAFLWPTKTSTAQNLPIGVTGPDTLVTTFEDAADKASPGTFDFVAAKDRDDAVRQIKTRETYGAIVLAAPPAAPEVLTAPAGSAVATQLLTGVAGQLQAQIQTQVDAKLEATLAQLQAALATKAAGGAQAGGAATPGATAAPGQLTVPKVTVTAVVPLSDSDPTGSGLAAASFPMMMGGMIGGILVSLLIVGPLRRLAALLGFATVAGIATALIMQTWFGFLEGSFWLNALALGASMLATASFIVGCASLIGRAGIAAGPVVTMLFANPISAAAVPWQFLPQPWGQIGQWFVPGASNWLIRSVSFFPDADPSKQWWVLGGWIALGVVLTLVGHFRSREEMRIPAGTLEAPEPEPEPALA